MISQNLRAVICYMPKNLVWNFDFTKKLLYKPQFYAILILCIAISGGQYLA